MIHNANSSRHSLKRRISFQGSHRSARQIDGPYGMHALNNPLKYTYAFFTPLEISIGAQATETDGNSKEGSR